MQFGAQLSNYGTTWADIHSTVTTLEAGRWSSVSGRRIVRFRLIRHRPPRPIVMRRSIAVTSSTRWRNIGANDGWRVPANEHVASNTARKSVLD